MLKNKIVPLIFLGCLLFVLTLSLDLIKKPQNVSQKAVETSSISLSSKKGIAGNHPLKSNLQELKVSWFYSWGHLPGTVPPSWDPELWQYFVPMFALWKSTNFDYQENLITQVCANTNYCHGGYYLVGNEPDDVNQEQVGTLQESARHHAWAYGELIKRIKNHDPQAKIILLGLATDTDDHINNFLYVFIDAWKTRWVQDPALANLADVIKGWHLHTYGNYDSCPGDQRPSIFKQKVDSKMRQVFGKTIPNEEIWVTEMGSLSPPAEGNVNRAKFLSHMRCIVNNYEKSPVVTRYSWFWFGCPPENPQCYLDSWLINNKVYSYQNGSLGLTDLGRLYIQLPTVNSPSPTPLATNTPSVTPTAAKTPTPTATSTPTNIPPTLTPTPTPTPTAIPTVTPPRPTSTPTPTATQTPTTTPRPINTPTVTSSPTPTSTLIPTSPPAGCTEIIAYDQSGQRITATRLNTLKVGDRIRFEVNTGNLNLAEGAAVRISINNIVRDTLYLTQKTAGGFTSDFYSLPAAGEYQIEAFIYSQGSWR